MGRNKELNEAKKNKNDEFYTQLSDIEKEVKYYRPYFKDKVVLCNCDDPKISNFTKYFILNFKFLGLKKLICTCYKNQNPNIFSEEKCEKAIYMEYNGTKNENDIPNEDEVIYKELKGNGDFRSQECVQFLKEADIVVTNPPFSLFREYVQQLIQYDKKFLIIGNINSIATIGIFPLIANNKVWLGVSIHSGDRKFNVPDDYPLNASKCGIDPDGRKYVYQKGVRWFTNLDHNKRHEPYTFICKYNSESYPKADNFNAIIVKKSSDIPEDYDGVMALPISFLDRYNADDFDIVAFDTDNDGNEIIYYYGDNKIPNKKLRNPALSERCYLNGTRLSYKMLLKRKR